MAFIVAWRVSATVDDLIFRPLACITPTERGSTFTLRKGDLRVMPFVQPFGGVTRSSAVGAVICQPTFELETGIDIRLRGKLALGVIPAEYVLAYASGRPLGSYQAAAGFAYTFGKH